MTDLPTLIDSGDVAAALEAARPNIDHADIQVPPTALVLARRDDVVVEVVDTERLADAPRRSIGTVKALTAVGFLAAVARVKTDATAVYADIDATTLTAVINDDLGTEPGWRDHRITYSPQVTPEWEHWINGQGLRTQGEFATVIEGGELEIREPSATVMLELAQTFQASSSAKFKQAGRLRDGRTQLVYEEDIEATAGEGLVAIPDVFVIEVRPFYGAEPRRVECRLRYRLDRGDLRIGYTIQRPEEILRDSFERDVVAQVGLHHDVIAAAPAGQR
jgi:uncharacterized protein YfdQ (DUF2303 family)